MYLLCGRCSIIYTNRRVLCHRLELLCIPSTLKKQTENPWKSYLYNEMHSIVCLNMGINSKVPIIDTLSEERRAVFSDICIRATPDKFFNVFGKLDFFRWEQKLFENMIILTDTLLTIFRNWNCVGSNCTLKSDLLFQKDCFNRIQGVPSTVGHRQSYVHLKEVNYWLH